jgi:biotin carboxyl carrier protein
VAVAVAVSGVSKLDGGMGETFVVTIGPRTYSVALEDVEGGKVRAVVDGVERVIEARRVSAGTWSIVDGIEARLVDVDGVLSKLMVEVSHPDGDPRQATASVADHDSRGIVAGAGTTGATGAVTLRAPIPGKLVKVGIKVGDVVKAGQTVLVLEAMKMENEIRAPRDAAVLAVHVAEGTAVETGHDLVTLG